MNCIIIDDEPLAHTIIESYCQHLEDVTILHSYKSAMEALHCINTKSVDLIFLDINMPVLKGLDFLRTLENPPMVIITSAYQEYALEGYELNVIDYLLKPFELSRFLKAVNKALNSMPSVSNTQILNAKSYPPLYPKQIFIKSDRKIHQIHTIDILFLESAGSYVKIHLEDRMIMTLERLSNYENLLAGDDFIRVHKSFIVAIGKIETLEGNCITIKGNSIPVGKTYRVSVKKIVAT